MSSCCGYYTGALRTAASEGLIEIVNFLLYRVADISTQDTFAATPLIRALSHGHLEMARVLLQSSESASSINDNNSRVALSWAAR